MVVRRKKASKAAADLEAAEALRALEEEKHVAELEKLQGRIGELEGKLRRQKQIEKTVRARHEELRLAVGIAEKAGPPRVMKIRPKRGTRSTEATCFAIASDWHVEEIVEPESVNGLNEYNSKIAERRARAFFRSLERLVEMANQNVKVTTIVLALLGDFITNQIHEDNAESNELLPVDAIVAAQSYIASGIRFLLEHTPYKLIIPCHSGNHGRTTRKPRAITEHGHSLEYQMYRSLELFFENEPRVEVRAARSYHSFIDCYGYVVRLHHGHKIRYMGGVGGIHIPTKKKIAVWNTARHADLDVFGHFHQLLLDAGPFVCNGSLIGHTALGIQFGSSYEAPKQAFFVVDSKRGKTLAAPIIVQE